MLCCSLRQTLHDSGARLFFVGNTPPQGCNPAQLTLFDNRPKDSLNCVDDINSINRAYGTALRQVVDQLRTSFSGDGTQIYYIDNYNASIEIYTNPGTYGFTNTQQACCGSGGPYNYNSAFTCGNVVSCCPGQSACATPGSYVAWDGIHYTQEQQSRVRYFGMRYVDDHAGRSGSKWQDWQGDILDVNPWFRFKHSRRLALNMGRTPKNRQCT
ncbi:hypothetical protein M758_5G154500 [Ceratodon purpureus]|nr:hypothetical protein M758_5G154500 [Ceratodon purpureus]